MPWKNHHCIPYHEENIKLKLISESRVLVRVNPNSIFSVLYQRKWTKWKLKGKLLSKICWVCVIFFPRLAPRVVHCAGRSRGVTRGEAAPTVGVRGCAPAKIVLVCGPTHSRTHPCFVHEFAHGFGVRWFLAPGIL